MPQRRMQFVDDDGNTIVFDWHLDRQPTEDDLQEIRNTVVQPQPDTRSFLGELFGGIGQELLPFQTADEARALIGVARKVMTEDPFFLTRQVIQQQKETFGRGLEQVEEGAFQGSGRDIARGIGTTIAGAIPLIGPAAAGVGEAFAEPAITETVEEAAFQGAGTPGAVAAGLATPEGARAIGRGVGMIAPDIVGAQAARRGARTAARATETIDPRGVPLLRSESGRGGMLSRTLEQLAEGSLFGAKRMKDFRRQQAEALNRAVEDAVTQVFGGPEARTKGRQVGELAQEAAAVAQQSLKKEARKLFDLVDAEANPRAMGFNIQDGRPMTVTEEVLELVDITNVQNEARDLMQRLGLDLGSEGRNFLQAILDKPKNLTFADAQDIRSDLLSIARGTSLAELTPGKRAARAGTLAGTLDEAMEAAATKLPDNVQASWREANAIWTRLRDDFDRSLLTKISNTSAEGVAPLLRNATVDDIRLLRRNLDEGTWQKVKGSFAERLVEDAMEPVVSPSPILGFGPQEIGGDVRKLNANSFNRNFNNLRKRGTLDEIFDAGEIADFQELADIAKRASGAGRGLLAQMLNGYMLAQGSAALFGGGVGAFPVAGLGVMQNVTARMMTTPAGRGLLKGIWRNANNPTTRTAVVLGNQLSQFMTGEEERQLQEILERQQEAQREPNLLQSLQPVGQQQPIQ